MSRDGIVAITTNRFRTQERNRWDALDRLVATISEAAVPPKYRRPTKPSKGAKQRRLDSKRHQSNIKKTRGRVGKFD